MIRLNVYDLDFVSLRPGLLLQVRSGALGWMWMWVWVVVLRGFGG